MNDYKPTGKLAFAYKTIKNLESRIAELEAALAEASKDAERWRSLRTRVGGRTEPNGKQVFTLSAPEPVSNIMRGSVAQHWDAAIDSMKGTP